MKHKYLLLAVASLLLCSCGGDKVAEDARYFAPDKFKVVNSAPDTTQVLKFEKLPIEILAPDLICVKDSLMVVTTRNAKALISIVNLNNQQVVAQIAPQGRGPNDFMGNMVMTNANFYYNDSGELILDADDMISLKSINITKSIREQGTYLEGQAKLDELYENTKYRGRRDVMHIGADSYFIRQGVTYKDARENKFYPPHYVIKSPKSQTEINIYAETITSEKERMLPLNLYTCKVRMKPDHTKVVEALGWFDYINILDLKSGKVVAVGEEGAVQFAEYNSIAKLPQIIKRAIADVAVSDKYIVALCNGQTKFKTSDGHEAYWKSVRVFDWNGKYVAGAMIPQGVNVQRIAYDGNKNIAYFLNMFNEEFYCCDLSELLK